MGIDYSTYIGPYVECRFSNKDDIEKRRCCPKKDCKEYGKNLWDEKQKFCNQCGEKITAVEFPVVVGAVDEYEIRMSFNEALHTPMGDELHFWQKENNIHIWMPNQYLKCEEYPRIELEHQQSSIRDIPVELPANQIEAFKIQFEKEIAVLESNYGKENMTFKWGVVYQVH